MRTIEEIRQRKIEGKKKWGKDLLEFITPYLDAGRTYEEIAIILDKDYNLQINSLSLANLKSKYRYKSPEGIKTASSETVQKQDSGIEKSKTEVTKIDFRTPTPKPSYESWKK